MRVKQSKSQQIVPNAMPWIDHIRDEKLPARSRRERDVADVDRDRQPFDCGAPIENATANNQPQVFDLESHMPTKLFQPGRKLVNPSDDLPKIDAIIYSALSWRAG